MSFQGKQFPAEMVEACVFRRIPSTDSELNRPPIPIDSVH